MKTFMFLLIYCISTALILTLPLIRAKCAYVTQVKRNNIIFGVWNGIYVSGIELIL